MTSVPNCLTQLVEPNNVRIGAQVVSSRFARFLATLDYVSPKKYPSSTLVEPKVSGDQPTTLLYLLSTLLVQVSV